MSTYKAAGVWDIYSGSGRNATDVKGKVVVTLSCTHCGGAISQHGPEVWHTASTMIMCEGNLGTKATV